MGNLFSEKDKQAMIWGDEVERWIQLKLCKKRNFQIQMDIVAEPRYTMQITTQ
jgi:hypothetical protein